MSDKQYLLITVIQDWADEFDTYGFSIMLKSQYEEYLENIKKYFNEGGEPVEVCFGTNENHYYESADDVIDCLTIKNISEPEFKTIKNLIGITFGNVSALNVLDYA